jgi:hypothetical protein
MTTLHHRTGCYPELWPEAEIERDRVEMKRSG